MEQDFLTPSTSPRTSSQAFSPLGCFLAAAGVTMLTFSMFSSAMVASIWAFSQLFHLPNWLMYALLAAGSVPVLWATIWVAGRAWHVERRLAQHLDVDAPIFSLGYYLKKR